MKMAPVHCEVLWQVSQVCGNPDVTWFGLIVFWKSARWQETQVVGSVAYWLFTWQVAQATLVCFPVSGNLVVL